MDMTYEELSEENEAIVLRLAKDGNTRAAHRLVASIYPLIVKEAKEQCVKCSMSMTELINEGVIGVYRAIKEFDLTAGVRFGTYAYGEHGWIKAYIQEAVQQSHLISISRRDMRNSGVNISFFGFDSPLSGDSDLTIGDTIKSNDDDRESIDIKVEYKKRMCRLSNLNVFDLIEDLPDGIEKETFKCFASGMTTREIEEETGVNRMTATRQRDRAIATLKKIVLCRR